MTCHKAIPKMPQFSCFTPHFLMSHGHFLRCGASFFDIPMVIFLVLTHTFLNTINQISFFHFFISSFQRSAFAHTDNTEKHGNIYFF